MGMHAGERSLVAVFAVGLLAGCNAVPTTGTVTAPKAVAPVRVSPKVGGCAVFPATNTWNTPVNTYGVRSGSSTYVSRISSTGGRSFLHADFGGGGQYGIPFKVVPASQSRVAINYTAYGDESDPGPFPIPSNTPIEGGSSSTGDRHVIVVQQAVAPNPCHLFELYRAFWSTNHWNADSGATWNLGSNAYRPLYWTSADAAGLPILPGLVRYDEVAAGHIDHALRFTVSKTQKGFVLPARHYASSSTDATLPPMGLRLRLKANFDLTRYHGQSLVILKALKTYGMIVADNGSSWFITGAADARWNDTDLNQLKTVPGAAFEVANVGGPITH